MTAILLLSIITPSTERPSDVLLGVLLLGVLKDLLGWSLFHEVAGPSALRGVYVKKRCRVRDAFGLLQVVGHDGDRVLFLEILHQLFDFGRGDRIERGTGLVHEKNFGFGGDGAGDAQA